MPEWPIALPKPIFDQIQIAAPINGVKSTETDTGPGKRRRRSSAVIRPVSLAFAPVSAAGLSLFESFFDTDLGAGVHRFTMDHPIYETSATWRFSKEDHYQIVPIGEDAYQLSISLELIG